MKHHFGDFLPRDQGYWTVVPNRERYAYSIGDVAAGSTEITIVTVGNTDKEWERIFTLPNLDELTLHEPSKEQLLSVGKLVSIKRLRITHARPKDIEFIRSMSGIEELVLEYVSGFADLSPLQSLPQLRSLHLENLRKVTDFSGLSGMPSLAYLSMNGTLDWKQPIDNFEFLRGLPKLEVLSLWQFINKTPFPALLPVTDLVRLKTLRLHGSYLAPEEYAFLEVALEGIEGASWGPTRKIAYSTLELPSEDLRARLPEKVLIENHPEVTIAYDGKRLMPDPDTEWIEFTGKKSGRTKCTSSTFEQRCREFTEKYNAMKEKAHELLTTLGASS